LWWCSTQITMSPLVDFAKSVCVIPFFHTWCPLSLVNIAAPACYKEFFSLWLMFNTNKHESSLLSWLAALDVALKCMGERFFHWFYKEGWLCYSVFPYSMFTHSCKISVDVWCKTFFSLWWCLTQITMSPLVDFAKTVFVIQFFHTWCSVSLANIAVDVHCKTFFCHWYSSQKSMSCITKWLKYKLEIPIYCATLG
jgi:hypothetical protein